MLIRAGFEIGYDLPGSTAMLLVLLTHPSRQPTLRREERLAVTPAVNIDRYTDMFGNTCCRLASPAGPITLHNDFVVEDSGLPDHIPYGARQHTIEELPYDVLVYLLGSRYCVVQEMVEIAWNLFGTTPLGCARVQAVCQWVYDNVKFDYMSARPTKTSWDV